MLSTTEFDKRKLVNVEYAPMAREQETPLSDWLNQEESEAAKTLREMTQYLLDAFGEEEPGKGKVMETEIIYAGKGKKIFIGTWPDDDNSICLEIITNGNDETTFPPDEVYFLMSEEIGIMPIFGEATPEKIDECLSILSHFKESRQSPPETEATPEG